MKHVCPDSECLTKNAGLVSRRPIRKGSFWRRSDGQRIPRFQCVHCRKTFSSARSYPAYRQRKRTLNHRVDLLLNSGVSQRRAALILGCARTTVVRKYRFVSRLAHFEQKAFLRGWVDRNQGVPPLGSVQFDDLETSEHSKCKPLSVAIAVEPKSRKILGFQVSQMPAKGPLAEIAYRRYGPRRDERSQGWERLLASLQPLVKPDAQWLTDQNPHYPRHLRRHFPKAQHATTPGRRGCVVGQGELKRGGYDPLFSLNHTCAMLRANLNRLFRRTWCTTKTRAGLIDHLNLYVRFHNQVLTPPLAHT